MDENGKYTNPLMRSIIADIMGDKIVPKVDGDEFGDEGLLEIVVEKKFNSRA